MPLLGISPLAFSLDTACLPVPHILSSYRIKEMLVTLSMSAFRFLSVGVEQNSGQETLALHSLS